MFQPIVRMADGEVVGYEALCRSVEPEPVAPSDWFVLASRLDRRVELERACLLAVAEHGAPPRDALLFVNVSPALLAHPDSVQLRDRLPRRLVLELTEREEIDDVVALRQSCAPWLRSGARLAIDDAGAGYSSLKQVVELLPEFVKIDRSLIVDIHRDRHRQALVAALVGFASEIGANVIAEGVESRAELAWLRDADVALAQGFLLGRPDAPWPSTTDHLGPRQAREPQLDKLAARIDAARSRRGACEAVAAHLFRQGGLMPSAYLEEGGRLRCQAQRGLWQVLDGMVPTAGITGRTFRTGLEHYVDDITAAPDYLEAIPGVVSELCVPLRTDDLTVGALNVESLVPLSEAVRAEVRACAELLGHRLGDLAPEQSRVPLRRLARTAASLAAVEDAGRTIDAVLAAARELSNMGSAMLVLEDEWSDGERRHTAGPLSAALDAMTVAELAHLSNVLEPLTSCYTAGEATGRSVTASETLRDVGARSLVALPITARGRRTGLLILTDSTPVALGPEQVEPLELLAVLAGSCLETAATVEELRRQARRDALTGIGNHSAFHERLRSIPADEPVALLMLDIDRFKQVNDTGGHLLGDQVLREVSDGLRRVLGDPEAVYRIGGDEFAVLLFAQGVPPDAHTTAAAIQRRVGTLLAGYGSALSIGVAHRRHGEALIDALERADAQLYLAKATGAAGGASVRHRLDRPAETASAR
ncbi:EAL domain-containing protein [Aquihabitans sp. G128]|uniref:EAL domain-containing protein n=1 Tax=Aquihabitans sp. G128 TaxID=2849779 RepID=UPI001C21B193|nr:EAL domain-containing protein [Aquihabitans sp. G128]